MKISDMRPLTNAKQMSDAEWETRVDLACAYRLFGHLGWNFMIYNHISARVPDEPDHFLINPFGLLYREVTASNLVKIDMDGKILDGSPHRNRLIRMGRLTSRCYVKGQVGGHFSLMANSSS